MRILIINSDAPMNRGDRAILAGLCRLAREAFPQAEIWALSQFPERDAAWYGIRFLRMSPYSLNPLAALRLMLFASRCDFVLWGGGELLKDYTNKIGLLYWFAKMALVRLANRNLYGAYQGIGPTKSAFGRRLIVMTVSLTKRFIVRDAESCEKLRAWGVTVPVAASFDPAILNLPGPLDPGTLDTLQEHYGIGGEDLENACGVSLRRWFHYSHGGWIPFRFRPAPRNGDQAAARLEAYSRHVAELCDGLVERHGFRLLMFPMHLGASEGDTEFCEEVVSRMRHAKNVRIIAADLLSPQQTLDLIGRCRLFLGARLHSTILAASAATPAFVFYYVDKGRLFFEQIGMSRFSRPIEDLLEASKLSAITADLERLYAERDKVRTQLEARLPVMREQVIMEFRRSVAADH